MQLIREGIAAVNKELKSASPEEKKSLTRRLWQLRKGYLPGRNAEIIALLDSQPDAPLSFLELHQLSTWFSLHPDKIAGVEKPTSSREFPVTVKLPKGESLHHFFNRTLFNLKNQMKQKQQRRRALFSRIKQNALMGALALSGLAGLPSLGKATSETIEASPEKVERVLKKSKVRIPGTNTLDFKEVFKLYNAGISQEETRSWVWYQRTLGVPMHGWEDFYLDSSSGAVTRLITTEKTTVYSPAYKALRSAPPGTVLGRKAGKPVESVSGTFVKFRSAEGLFLVNASQVKEQRSAENYGSDKELRSLVRAGALFYYQGELLPGPVYAFGNLYDREQALLREADHIEKTYGPIALTHHKALIDQAKPSPLSVADPDPALRPHISLISEFTRQHMVSELSDDSAVFLDKPLSLQMAFVKWLGKLDRSQFRESSSMEIYKYYLLGKRITGMLPEDRAELKARSQREGERLFGIFLHSGLSSREQKKLDLSWNVLFNGYGAIQHHKVPVGFQASSRFKQFSLELRPAQREAIAFMKLSGSGGLAYNVGVGKTISAIVTLADAIQSGRAKRPLVVVPNAVYEKWIAEIAGSTRKIGGEKVFVPGVLSGTGIKVQGLYNLGKRFRSRIDLEKAVPEKSITVLTWEGFKRIGFSEEVFEEMAHELATVLEQTGDPGSERSQQINLNRYRKALGKGLKGTVADIDSLGFDYIVLDEAHRAKNIFEAVKKDDHGNKRFGISGRQSETGLKAFFLCNYIQRRYGEKVMLLSATPFSNSPLEIWSMFSLIALNKLKARNLDNIQRFFETFIEERSEPVVTYRETIENRRVIKSFRNRQILQPLIHNYFLYKSGEEEGFQRPCKINLPRLNADGKRLAPKEQILTYLKMTPEQRRIQDEVVAEAQNAVRGRFNLSGVFRALARSQNNAFSPFLAGGLGQPVDAADFVENSPKIEYICRCIASVKAYHEKRGEPVSGQVIYSNRGKTYFPLIKEYLISEVGFEKGRKFGRATVDEVEIIDSSVSGLRREAIVGAFNEGIVKVLIGTATIREGVDLQKRSTVLYNAYPDWNPTDIRQLEGRIWRQGNRFGYVRVVMPLVMDSADVFVFQKLEEKTHRINDIWYRSDRGNVLDLESLDPEEIKLALITDDELLAKQVQKKEAAEKDSEIRRLTEVLKNLDAVQTDLKSYAAARETAHRQLNAWMRTMEYQTHIRFPKSEESYLSSRTLKKDYQPLLKDLELYRSVQAFTTSGREDRELLLLIRKLVRHPEITSTQVFSLNRFREVHAAIRKTEKQYLSPKGFTLNSELSDVIQEYRNDLEARRKEKQQIASVAYLNALVDGIRQKREALLVDGKSVEERVEEFAATNHLLSFMSADTDTALCRLPAPSEEKPASAKRRNSRRSRLANRLRSLV